MAPTVESSSSPRIAGCDEESQATVLRHRSWFSARRSDGRREAESDNLPPVTAREKNVEPAEKLGTFSGVWVPTTLNVLSILMFLRFGFLLGQGGVLGVLSLLVISYLINLITTLSISAISSNGTVRGGGAYYLISRSLGPEFGGSIGIVFYLGFVFNTGMNAVGMVDCLINNFGATSGTMAKVFPESFWLGYLYATAVLVFCTVICLLGSAIFSRASNILLAVLLLATFSIPFSSLLQAPFIDEASGTVYTGLSMQTLKENFMPRFTAGAAGGHGARRENWQDLFGILFPATAGIFAGASMSGDLRNPSKSIPSGTLNGLLVTFVAYSLVIISMGATIGRETLYTNLNVIQDINISPHLILMGEFATSFFSALMGVIGSAKSLQALARDNIFPGLSVFGQGSLLNDEPTIGILFTFLLAQLTLFADVNTIASIVTMTYLITFWVTNMACFLLKIGSAPNFRPTFKFFTWWTAALGALLSLITMFFVDGFYAMSIIGVILALFLIIHYTTPPKSWGDVSQSLIYHQVRKYLLRLRQEHVKFWRPQILLFVNDPRRSWKLIQFCNSMKKGGLYVLGHIIVTADFQESFPEVKRQQSAWMKYIDFSKVKAFPQVAICPTMEWGARSVVLSAGLGGMRPNIAVLGFFNVEEYRNSRPLVDVPIQGPRSSEAKRSKVPGADIREQLPTDSMRPESAVTPMSYVNILEDLLLCLQINVAVAKGFDGLELPGGSRREKKYIDLWPIQMSAEDEFGSAGDVLTSNFDTYALILQLGCILNTVPAWKKTYQLRVAVFVEFQADIAQETERVKKLLENLRIQAEILVVCLAESELSSYDAIVNGSSTNTENMDLLLKGELWWTELQAFRRESTGISASSGHDIDMVQLIADHPWPSSSFQQQGGSPTSHGAFRNLLSKAKNRQSISHLARRLSSSISSTRPKLEHSRSSQQSSGENETEDTEYDASSLHDSFSEPNPFSSSIRRRVSGGDIDQLARMARRPSLASDAQAPNPSAGSSTPTVEAQLPRNKLLLKPMVSGRPSLLSRSSSPHFSCKAIPETQLSSNEGPGPTITFADDIDGRHRVDTKTSLSFNDLPSSGQHVILNELFRRHSSNTAVVFTTLPSPTPGTWKDERESLDYLTSLDTLTADMPPVLLVHSNSMTVTTSL